VTFAKYLSSSKSFLIFLVWEQYKFAEVLNSNFIPDRFCLRKLKHKTSHLNILKKRQQNYCIDQTQMKQLCFYCSILLDLSLICSITWSGAYQTRTTTTPGERTSRVHKFFRLIHT